MTSRIYKSIESCPLPHLETFGLVVVVVSVFFVEDFIEATFVEVVVLVLLKVVVVVVDVIVVLVSVEKKVSCEPLIQTEIDSSVTPNSALFSW